jgi:uncharacterized protein
MTRTTAERAIDFALDRDKTCLDLSFFGGEPLLRIELLEYASAYAERRLRELNPLGKVYVHLTTNATLVDARVEDFVRRHPVTNVFVSLDGPAHIHDRHRINTKGQGSHASVREGVARLVEAGANIIPLAVVNPDTAGLLGEVTQELVSLPVNRAQLTCNLRATWDDSSLEALRIGSLAAAHVWGDQFRAGRCLQLDPFTMKVLSHLHGATPCPSRCQLEAHEYIVAPSGRIYNCGEIVGEDDDERFVIGDLDSGIWFDKLKTLRDAKNRIRETCEPCALHNRCASNCGCRQIALTNTLGHVTETFCEIEEAFISAADTIAEKLYREGCPAFTQFFYRERWVPNTPEGLAQLRRSAS